VLGFVRNVAAVAGSQDISRRELATTYARLRIGGRESPGSHARVLDWDVAYVDYRALVELFLEVFVRRHYPFRAAHSSPFVIDCGANIGVATMFFKTLAPQAEILAFEPEPTAFRVLRQNVEANRMASVECRPYAVGREAGRQLLRSPGPGHGASSLVFDYPGWTGMEVETVRLSECLDDRRVDFLKLDVEGSEHAVLADLVETGAIERVGEIGLEHHPRNPDDLPRLLQMLADAGFSHRLAFASDELWDPMQQLLVHAFRKPKQG
jgi:FkbM family methyltransferase